MKILLVQLSFLGDTILSTPVIAGLKLIYPDAKISVLTTKISAGLVENDPFVDEIIVYDKKEKDKGIIKFFKKSREIRYKQFNKVYSIHRSYRTALLLCLAGIQERIGFKDANLSFLYTNLRKKKKNAHAAIRNLSLLFNDFEKLNISKTKFKAELRLFEPAYESLSQTIKNISGKYIIMAPGSAWKTKQWHWQGYLEVARYYMKQGMNVILVGGRNDVAICSKICKKIDKKTYKKTYIKTGVNTGINTGIIDFSGKVSILETMYIMKNAKLLICNDSMSLHMASAFKIPTVAVFCATSPKFGFGPWLNPNAMVVEDKTLDCKPCRRHGSNQCPENTEKCMFFSYRKVIQACKKVL